MKALRRCGQAFFVVAALSFAASYGFHLASVRTDGKGYIQALSEDFSDRVSPKFLIDFTDDVDLSGVETLEIRTTRIDIEVDGPPHEIQVKTGGGNLEVTTSPTKARLKVKAMLSWSPRDTGKGSDPFSRQRDGAKLILNLADHADLGSGIHVDLRENRGKLQVQLPNSYRGAIVLRSTSGGLGADLEREGEGLSAATFDTISGDVQLDRLRVKSLDVRTVSGSQKLNSEMQTAELHSTSGDISVDLRAAIRAVVAKSVSGNILIRTSASAKPDLDYSIHTVSGDIHFPREWGIANDDSRGPRVNSGKMGAGSVRVDLKTVSGDLNFE